MPEGVQEVDVDRLATLVRLELSAEERELFSAQMAEIVAFARQVQGVDTDGVPPTARATENGTAERPDDERPCLAPDQALANAPARSSDHTRFKVPKVIGS